MVPPSTYRQALGLTTTLPAHPRATNVARSFASRDRKPRREAVVVAEDSDEEVMWGDYDSQKSTHNHVVRSRKSKQGMESRSRRILAKAAARRR